MFVSAEVSGEISDSYKKQLEVAKYVKENIAHSVTKENLMFYVAIWVHEPYIESSLKVLLEAMLTETGHRWHRCAFDKTMETVVQSADFITEIIGKPYKCIQEWNCFIHIHLNIYIF